MDRHHYRSFFLCLSGPPQHLYSFPTRRSSDLAICYGILVGEGEREAVIGSVRTAKVTMDVDQFLKRALGSDARGRYYGGGRSRAGGFEIPIGFLEAATDPEQARLKWIAFNRQIRGKLLSAAGLHPPEEVDDGVGAADLEGQ